MKKQLIQCLFAISLMASYSFAAEVTVSPDDAPACPVGAYGLKECTDGRVQAAVLNAQEGDVITVEMGVYVENIETFKAITIRGTNSMDPQVVGSTILDGGATGNPVVSLRYLNPNPPRGTLEGFTIENGTGGGVYIIGPWTVSNCVVRNNQAASGGGILAYGSEYYGNAKIIGTEIVNNSATFNGGGLYTGTYVEIVDSKISGNVVLGQSRRGAGAYLNSSFMSKCEVTGNHAVERYVQGGGIYARSGSRIEKTLVAGNYGDSMQGGGIYQYAGSLDLIDSVIVGNSGIAGFEGINIAQSSDVNIINSTITDPVASYPGSGVTTIANSIIWNEAVPVMLTANSSIVVTHSDVKGWTTGEGNIDADPEFRNPAIGDFQLAAGSPCIDRGLNSLAPTYDKNGAFIPQDGDENPDVTADMGAYEY